MIVSKTPQIARTVRYLASQLLPLLAWDVLIVVAFKVLRWEWIATSHLPLALYGSAIGIILGLRNNSAYARWWEARAIWGQIVNSSRGLARQVCNTLNPSAASDESEKAAMSAMRRRIVHHQIAYAHVLRQQLRGLNPVPELKGFLSEAETDELLREKNVALSLHCKIGTMLRAARLHGWVDHWEWQSMERNLDQLVNAQGGTERIKNTPMPKQYEFFPMLFVQIYCLLLPVGMVENLGWFTPLGSTLVGFMFLALDKIGRDLENPFDNQIYDVPLTSITRTIEMNLRQMLGETELPPAGTPVHGVLW